MDEEDEAHHAHRSGWHNLYRVDQQVPMRFDRPMPPPEAPKASKPPPPPPKGKPPARSREDDYAEFMEVTGVTARGTAVEHVDAARRHGFGLRDAIRHYFEHGGRPMESPVVEALLALGYDLDLARRAAELYPGDLEAAKAWCQMVMDLVGMGFDRAAAMEAASKGFGSLDEAAAWCLDQQRAPPAVRPPPPVFVPPPPPKAAPLRDADLALFDSFAVAPAPPPAPAPTRVEANPYSSLPPAKPANPYGEAKSAQPEGGSWSAPMGGEAPAAAIVSATNPYGKDALSVVSMPPLGVSSGASSAASRRSAANRVRRNGKLAKLSGLDGRRTFLGSRWQARFFVLARSTLAYGDVAREGGLAGGDRHADYMADCFAGTKKQWNLWGAYVVPEGKDRANGRDFAFAVYRSDEDVLRGRGGGGGGFYGGGGHGDRDQLCLLAAETEDERRAWIVDLLAASGRSGVVLKDPSTTHASLGLRCVYGSDALKMRCCVVDHKVLVRDLDADEGAGSVGVQVGDELYEVNGVLVPPLDAGAVTKILDAAARPLEMRLRRPTDPRRHGDLAKAARNTKTGDADRAAALRESLDVGEALRNDKVTYREQQERTSRRLRADDEAAATAKRAARKADEGDAAMRSGDHERAVDCFREALRALLDSRDALADPDSTARSKLPPNLDLAALYDHVQAMGQRAHDLATKPPPDLLDLAAETTAPPNAATNTRQGDVAALAASFERIGQTQRATATFAFEKSDDWQLALVPGMQLDVLKTMDDGWSEVRDAHGAVGLVPTGYFDVDPPVRV